MLIARRKQWSTWSSFKKIVNIVFNKSTQETRTQLFRLVLHKKEMLRKRINPKNRLQKELWHKIAKKGILPLTKDKLTVGVWWYSFEQVSRYIFYTLLFFGYNIVVTGMYVIFVTLNSMFSTNIEKNMQSPIV